MQVAAKRITPPDESNLHKPVLSDTADGASNVVSLPARTSTTAEATTDAELLPRLAVGDATAFRQLMQLHLSAVVATARRIVRDEAEAEDIAQEAFLKLWNNADTLESGSYGLRPWLRRVASNLAIDWLRKAKRFDVTDDLPEQADEARQLRTLEATEASARVEEALTELPTRQRVAISLFHFDDLSQREVAAAMDLTEDALESLLARGRRRLRELLKDDWQELLPGSGDS